MRPLGPGRLLAAVGVAAALLYLSGLVTGLPRVALKPVPVLALAAWVALRCRQPLGRLTAAGLLLSAVGDVLLDAGRFLPGLFAFLTAHVAYVAAFLSVERRPALGRALPFVAWGAGAFALLRPGLGSMALPVAVYVAVIMIMLWRAAARVGSPRTPALAALVGLAGALAFGVSDTLIAFDRFDAPIAGVRLPIMLLYWLGQWGIAASAVLGCDRPREGRSTGSVRESRSVRKLIAALLLACAVGTSAESQVADRFAIPATDDGLPGAGPIRRYDWFQNLWRERRSEWAQRVEYDRRAVVFLGDSITQGWGGGLGAAFPGVKVANRGISGDTTRGILLRLQEDVLALDPAAVVLLAGTNDLEEGATPEVIAGNLELILADLERHDARLPIVLCQVFPSSSTQKRPADKIKALNALYLAAAKKHPQVTLPRDLAALRRTRRRRDGRRVPRPAAPERDRLREVGGGAAPRLRDAGLLRDRRGRVRARGGIREPLQRPRPHRLGLSADLREGQGERRALAGLGSGRRRLADRHRSGRLRRPDRDAGRPLRRHRRTAGGQGPARVPEDPAALDDARVPARFRAEARVPRDAERRQRRLRARAAAAVPRLPPGRPLQGPEELQAAGLERARDHGQGRRGAGHLQRRSARGRARASPASGPVGVEGDRGQMEYRRIRIKVLAQ